MSEKEIMIEKNKYLLNEEYLADFNDEEIRLLFNRELILSQPGVIKASGRGQTLLYSTKGKHLVLRHYKRGGLFGKFVKDTFFKIDSYQHRAFDEFKMLSQMRKMGLNVPVPVAARETAVLFGIKQDIVIERLDGFKDLSYFIKDRELTDNELISIGKAIKLFFEKGILHTDLNIRNILMNESSDVYIIDFDKCFIRNLSIDDKNNIVNRLLRSFIKEKEKRKAYFNVDKFSLLKQQALS